MDNRNERKICIAAAVLGLAALFLRRSLYSVGFDHKGLLTAWHPLAIALIAAALGMLAVTAALVLPMKKETRLAPTGLLAGAGSFAMGAGLACTALMGPARGLSRPVVVLGLLAAAAMGLAGISQLKNRQPHFLTHGVLCLFLGFYLVTRYRVWSQDPQILDYILALLGGTAMMVYSYHMAAGNLALASRRAWLSWGALGAFFGLAGAAGGEAVPLCLGGALWILTGLWRGTAEGRTETV